MLRHTVINHCQLVKPYCEQVAPLFFNFQANLQNCTIKLDLLGVELSLVPYKRSPVLFPFSASTAVPKEMAREVSALKVVLHGYF